MPSFNVGDTVRIKQGSTLKIFDGLTCEVVGAARSGVSRKEHFLRPLTRRPDFYNEPDFSNFYWPADELELVTPEDARLTALRKAIDSLRNDGYTVKVSVTAPAPKAVIL